MCVSMFANTDCSESFVQEYFDKAMVKVAAAEHATLPAPQPARQSKQPQSLLDMP